jgi:osmoprotectant transport system permease protein
VEQGVSNRDRRKIASGLFILAVGTLAAIAPLWSGQKAAYVVGAKNFSEQYILADLMAQRLRAQGARVGLQEGLGSAIAFRALSSGDIDAYVDYTGTLWTNVMGRKDTPPRDVMLAELTQWMSKERGVTVLGPLGFENAYVLALRRSRAEELGIRSIDDLARQASGLALGADIEFLDRPEWAALREAYGLRFRQQNSYNPTFMYRALASGTVDVISAFSSDGRIAADNLMVLEDPRHAVPNYDAVILLAPKRANDAVLRQALQPLVGAIRVEAMRVANYAVDRDDDKRNPAQAAEDLGKAIGVGP